MIFIIIVLSLLRALSDRFVSLVCVSRVQMNKVFRFSLKGLCERPFTARDHRTLFLSKVGPKDSLRRNSLNSFAICTTLHTLHANSNRFRTCFIISLNSMCARSTQQIPLTFHALWSFCSFICPALFFFLLRFHQHLQTIFWPPILGHGRCLDLGDASPGPYVSVFSQRQMGQTGPWP